MRKKSPDTETSKKVRERIKQLIDDYCDGKQIVFSEKTGIPKGTVSHYVNGGNIPSDPYMKKIADTFSVSELWIRGYDVKRNAVVRDMSARDIADYVERKNEPVFANVFDAVGFRLSPSDIQGQYTVYRFPDGTTDNAESITITSKELERFTEKVSEYSRLLISDMFNGKNIHTSDGPVLIAAHERTDFTDEDDFCE